MTKPKKQPYAGKEKRQRKLPVPPPKQASSTAKPGTLGKAIEDGLQPLLSNTPAKDDGLPESLRIPTGGRPPLPPDAQAKVDRIMADAKAATGKPDYRAMQKEAAKAKAKVKATARKQKAAAAEAGITTAMPLTGKDALAAIRGKTATPAKAPAAPAVAKPQPTAKRPEKPQDAKKSTGGGARTDRPHKSAYDWSAAEETASQGKLPPLPPFNSYKPHIAKFYALAKAGDLDGIRKLSAEYKDETGARANMFRFRDLLVTALKNKAA